MEEYECISTMTQENPISNTINEEDSTPQVYALDFINWSSGGYDNYLLLSSADDFLHLYEIQKQEHYQLIKVISFHFVHYYNYNHGVNTVHPNQTYQTSNHIASNPYGGPRNPNNLIFLFDTSFAEYYLATALSDGTIRILNTRGVCICILQLPPNEQNERLSHLTSVSWCADDIDNIPDGVCRRVTEHNECTYRLVSCVANGTIILWNIYMNHSTNTITPSCRAIFQGGHAPNRPIFGARFFKNYILSWGMDGNVCLWDGVAFGDVLRPIGYVARKEDYPFYACDVFEGRVAGAGGRDGGFIGTPLYLYDNIA